MKRKKYTAGKEFKKLMRSIDDLYKRVVATDKRWDKERANRLYGKIK